MEVTRPFSTASYSCSSCLPVQEHGALIKQGDEQVCDTPGSGDPQPIGRAGGRVERAKWVTFPGLRRTCALFVHDPARDVLGLASPYGSATPARIRPLLP